MEKKKISLAVQYSMQALMIFGLLSLYVVSRENFGFKQYEPIISRLYYMGLILFALMGLIRRNEKVDESAEKVLGKVTSICLQVATLGLIILVILSGSPFYKEIKLSRDIIGLLILGLLFIITSLKPILFYYFDRKGL